jgi:hypothetical protein
MRIKSQSGGNGVQSHRFFDSGVQQSAVSQMDAVKDPQRQSERR